MPPKKTTQESSRSTRPKRQPKVVVRPSPAAFRAGAARLDGINATNPERRKPIMYNLSEDDDCIEPSPTPGPSRPRRTAVDGRNVGPQQRAEAPSSTRTLRSSPTQDVGPPRRVRNARRAVTDSEDEYEDDEEEEEAFLTAKGPMSSARNIKKSLAIQHSSSKTPAQGRQMLPERHRQSYNAGEDDLDIDMHGWGTPSGNKLDTLRQTRAELSKRAASLSPEFYGGSDQMPMYATPPATLPRNRHFNAFGKEQAQTNQDVTTRASVLRRRQATSPTPTSAQPKVKARKSRTYDYVELNPLFQRYNTRTDPAYDPIRDLNHPIHAGCDISLPSMENVCARRERVRLWNEKRELN